MSEIFAEATVTLVPDTRGFATRLQAQLKEVITAIETGPRAPKIRVAPALTKNFVGELRRQVNTAVAQAQKGVKPIQVRAVLTDVSSAAIAREVGARARTVGVPGGQASGRARVAAETRAATEATMGLQSAEKLLSSTYARGLPILGQVQERTSAIGKERSAGAASIRNVTQLIEQQTVAQIAFARAQQAAAEAQLHVAGSSQQSAAFRRAERFAVEAITVADKNQEQALLRSVQAFRDQLRVIPQANAALGEHSREAASVARSHSQLRRGALATSLSFLGIRGATLAASASFLAGAAAIAIFAKALDNATRFTDQLNVFRATTGATAQELEQVRDVARELGADLSLPGVTAADAAEAMTELAKAGLDVQNAIAGTRGVLQLATAAAIENAQAVELVANALNAFQLQGEDATRVADAFANAANAAQGSIVDIGIAFQQSAAAGRQVGLSFQDTTAFLTVLARAGLRGSDAGTSLRTALIRLINPSKEAAARLKSLGIEARDATGNLRPDVFIQIASATRDLTKAERDRVIALVGGQDAFRAISILGRQSIQDFIRLRRELRQQGTAADLAAARMQGLRGALEGLGNLLSTVGIRIGQAVTPGIQSIVEGISSATASMAASDQVARTLGDTLGFVEESARILGATLGALGTVLLPVASGLEQIANAVGIGNILAAVAAYKLLPAIFIRIRATATIATVAMSLMALQGVNPLRAGITALIGSFNLWALGAAAVAAGLFFLITRETEAERATRHLTEAVQGLADAQLRLNQARRQSVRADTSVNQARLDLLNAQGAVAGARERQAAAPRGTQERVRANLELAVALDNVVAAQQRVREAEQAAADAQLVFLNAQRREREERVAEIASLRESADAIRERIRVQNEGNRDAETRAAADFTAELDKQIAKLRESDDVELLRSANRLARLRQFIDLTGKVPSEQAFDIVVNAPDMRALTAQLTSEFGITGKKAVAALEFAIKGEGARRLKTAFQGVLDSISGDNALPRRFHGLGARIAEETGNGVRDNADAIASALATAVRGAMARVQGLVREGLQLEIEGASPGERLANARARLVEEQKILAIQRQRAGANSDASISVRRAQERVRQAQEEIASIEGEIATAAQEAADKAKEAADAAKEAADAADKAALSRLERTRNRAQDRIADAQATETLQDDLRATIAFRNLIRRQINRIRDLIKDREVERDAIRALQAIERDLGREITSLQKQRRDQIRDRIAESIQLDIEFGQITENARIEINARRREIERLRKLQAEYKRGTIEYRRLRNLIAEQQQAIEELTKQQKDKNNAAAELGFQFLQAQSGFVANLLGNLIPGGATGGLVGGGGFGGNVGAFAPTTAGPLDAGGLTALPLPGIDPRTGRPVRESGGVTEALEKSSSFKSATGGPTRGGQASELHLLREILATLRDIRRGTTHPEARNRRARDAAVMELSEHK